MNNNQERDVLEEEYWRNHCTECDTSPCQGKCKEKNMPSFYCVSIYMTDRAYGGPEEGGWWYGTGEPVKELGMHTRCFHILEEAQEYAEVLRNTILPDLNKGRRPISSVLSEGQFDVQIDEDEYPAPYPKERPYYC